MKRRRILTITILLLVNIVTTAPAQQLLSLEDTDSLKARREKTNSNFTMLNSLLSSKLTISLSNPANGHVPVLENGVWKNKAIASGNGMIIEDTDSNPSFGLVTRLQFDQADGFILSSPDAGRARVKLLVPWSKVSKSAQDVIDSLGPTPVINCSACTGIAGATGGVENTGSTTIAADTDADGSGVVDILTKGLSRLRVENNGALTAPDASGLANLDGEKISSPTAERDKFGNYYMRALRAAFSSIRAGNPRVARILVIGDSNVSGDTITRGLRFNLQPYGDAGIGFVPFSNSEGTPFGIPFVATTGTWTTVDGSLDATALGANGMHFTSSDSGTPASATIQGNPAKITGYRLHYIKKAGGGSFRYRVDSGSWTTVNTANASTDIAIINITGLSYETHNLTAEVVSGSISLIGAELLYSDSGVLVHRLGNGGITSLQYAALDGPLFQAAVAAFQPDAIIYTVGTNDFGQNVAVENYKTAIQTVVSRFRAAAPLADILLLAPTDNTLTHTHPMSEYSAAMQDVARTNGCGFVDGYKAFGPISDAGQRGLFSTGDLPDQYHYSITGGRLLADLIYDTIVGGQQAPLRSGVFQSSTTGFQASVGIPYGTNPGDETFYQRTNDLTGNKLWHIGNFGTNMAINIENSSGISIGDDTNRRSFVVTSLGFGSGGKWGFGGGTETPMSRLHMVAHGGNFPVIIAQGLPGQVGSVYQAWTDTNTVGASLTNNRLRVYNLNAGVFEDRTGNFEGASFESESNVYKFKSEKGGTGIKRPFSFEGAPVGLSSGAAVASAATITPTGNSFHVTGTTGISAISSTDIPAGTEITIIFDGAVLLTHSSSLELQGSTNFTTTAKTRCRFLFDGATWWETERIQP